MNLLESIIISLIFINFCVGSRNDEEPLFKSVEWEAIHKQFNEVIEDFRQEFERDESLGNISLVN